MDGASPFINEKVYKFIPSKPNIKTTNKNVTAISFVLIDKLTTSFTFLNYNIY